MYFDAVLDDNMKPLFNGTTEATVAWLKENRSEEPRQVCIGKTMSLVNEMQYLDLMS